MKKNVHTLKLELIETKCMHIKNFELNEIKCLTLKLLNSMKQNYYAK